MNNYITAILLIVIGLIYLTFGCCSAVKTFVNIGLKNKVNMPPEGLEYKTITFNGFESKDSVDTYEFVIKRKGKK